MKLRILFAILSVMVFFCLSAKIHTLSFCIGEYPTESGWNELGANNDARLIKDIFTDAQVIVNEKATHKRILNELAVLKSKVNRGDTVIVHFSGHGQQILSTQSSHEVDLVDEAIVPYDAYKRKSTAYFGQAHITDDIFGQSIYDIRKAVGSNGLVISVIDACHSDSMDKDADGTSDVYRGTDEIFGTEALSPDSIAKLRDLYDSPDKSPVVTSPELSNVVFISACATHQRNYEIKVEDVPYGSLTYYFCKIFEEKGVADLNGFLSCLYKEMTSDNIMSFHGQTPVIRNTIDWKAPSQEKYIPPTSEPSVRQDNSNVSYWWIAIGGSVAVVIIIFILCRKRKK